MHAYLGKLAEIAPSSQAGAVTCGAGPAVNTYCDRARVELVSAWLAAHSAYWRRHGGRDHVFWMTGDFGACGLASAGVNPIFITHLGLLGPYSTFRAVAQGQFDRHVFANMSSGAITRGLRGGMFLDLHSFGLRRSPRFLRSGSAW